MKILKIVIVIIVLGVMGTAGCFIRTRWIHPTAAVSEKSDSDIVYYRSGMHPWITSDKPGNCPICGMPLIAVHKGQEKADQGLVHIDPAMVQNIGVKTEIVTKRKLTHNIRTSGIVDYDETKQTVITTKYSGYIEKLYVDFTGKHVEKGQPLFEIYSPELVAAQQEYLQAVHYNSAMNAANDAFVSSGANDLLLSAKKKLLYWDISPAQVNDLEQEGIVKKTLTVYSPFSGVVTEKNIFDGMQVQAGAELLKLTGTAEMWVYADVYENELAWVKTGQKVIIDLPFNAGKSLQGKVSYINPYLQGQTRTARVRIDFSNNEQWLKKDMYVTVTILSPVTESILAVPEQAVIHSGTRNIVVLSLGSGKFKSEEVKLGVLADNYYEVKAGLDEGDTIVTSSQFLIDSESNLEAGFSSMQGMNMPGMKAGNKSIEPQNDKKDMNMPVNTSAKEGKAKRK